MVMVVVDINESNNGHDNNADDMIIEWHFTSEIPYTLLGNPKKKIRKSLVKFFRNPEISYEIPGILKSRRCPIRIHLLQILDNSSKDVFKNKCHKL